MGDLEKFANDDGMAGLPPLVFIAIFHYQFETIHPFPDGNGRVGRLLIPIILKQKDIMSQPLLYMSQFFEDNKEEYVDLMLRVSQRSEWIPWIKFFLEGVIQSCDNTIETIRKVQALREEYLSRCQQARSSALLIKIVDMLFEKIAITIPLIRYETSISYTAAANNMERLKEYGIVQEVGRFQRPKYFFATELMKIFEEQTAERFLNSERQVQPIRDRDGAVLTVAATADSPWLTRQAAGFPSLAHSAQGLANALGDVRKDFPIQRIVALQFLVLRARAERVEQLARS